MEAEAQQAEVRPTFYPKDSALDERCREVFNDLVAEIAAYSDEADIPLRIVRELRERAFENIEEQLQTFGQPARLAVSVLCDLVSQGWRYVSSDETTLKLERPAPGEDRLADKERVRRSLALARDEQLTEPAVRAFVKSMEARRQGPAGWCSIFSLMRDGSALARELADAQALPETEREERLAGLIQPYLQVVSEDARDEQTGLRLADIWRYFRYTWLTPARSVPGRTMMILVRDAAAPFHPVVGIASLSSSIVQQSERDRVIGWTRERVLEDLTANPTDENAAWLLRSLEESLAGLQTADLLTPEELESPTPEILKKLNELGFSERRLHQEQARLGGMKQVHSDTDWSNLVDSHLYRSKRAHTLADLLGVRLVFVGAGLKEASGEQLREALASGGESFKKAVARVVRQVKGSRVGINMMDISVCGSIAPYNALLGGKLVSMLLASPEIRAAYAQRYQAASVIASGMKGEAVHRRPDLVLLCTTGLFAGGSSQYNRVRVPKEAVPGSRGEVRYTQLDQETEFATFHISQATMEEMRLYAKQTFSGSNVNSIFGEGVNPKMRKIRESLAGIGFPPEEILKAGSPRAVYMVPLAKNFREVLSGRLGEPDYLLESAEPKAGTEAISAFWRRRWLAGRLGQPQVLAEVARHSQTYPLLHGAAVSLPESEDDEDYYQLSIEGLFEDIS